MKVSAAFLGAIAIGVAGEAWHANWGPCGGLHRPTILLVCTHPPGFWMLDFMAVTGAALLLIASFWIIAYLFRRIGRGKGRASYLMTPEWRIIALGFVVTGVAFAASFAALPLRQLMARLVDYTAASSFATNVQNVTFGIGFVVSVTIAPVLVVFAVLLVIGLLTSRSTYPLITAIGTFLGAVIGFLSPTAGLADPLLVALMEPILGRQYTSLYGIFLLAPVFAYASFILSNLMDGRALISSWKVPLHAAVGATLFLPLVISFETFSLLLLYLYSLVFTAAMIRFLISRRAPA